MRLINTTTKVILRHKISIFAVTANFTINEEIYNMVPDRCLKGKLFHWIQHKSMGNFHNTQVALGTLHVHPIGCLVKSDITVNSIMILSDTIKLDPVQNLRNFPSLASPSSLKYCLRWCSTSFCFAVISSGNFHSLDTFLVVGLRSAYIFVSFSLLRHL